MDAQDLERAAVLLEPFADNLRIWQTPTAVQAGREVAEYRCCGCGRAHGHDQDALTAKVVAKDWSTVFQSKLNIAWLPAEYQ